MALTGKTKEECEHKKDGPMKNCLRNFRVCWDFSCDGKFSDQIKTLNRRNVISGEKQNFIEKSQSGNFALNFRVLQYANKKLFFNKMCK